MIKFLDLQQVTALHHDEIREAVNRVIDGGWYILGDEVRQFEDEYARYHDRKFCVGCGNGLDALTLMLRAYIEIGEMQPGDEIIVPANTFIATILAITENGLVPVLAEPRRDTLEIDDSVISSCITDRTRAVMLVHLYGRNAYTERVGEICRAHGLKLLEDCAQSQGCLYIAPDGRAIKTGALGEASAHSFYPGKNLGALGDGGAVLTNDARLAEVVRALGNYGSQRKYVFGYQGRNSRLDEIQAAILRVKLRYLDDDNAKRKTIADYYYENINNPLVRLPKRMRSEENVYHLFPIFCEHREALQAYLLETGIQTQVHYPIAPHQQECYANHPAMAAVSLPVTEELARQELSLPISPCMTLEEAKVVVDCVNGFCR